MPLIDQGALTLVKRWNHAVEAAALRGAPGAFTNGRHSAEGARKFGRNKRVNNTQMSSRRETYGSKPGAKTFTLDTRLIATEYLYTDYKDIFATVFGKEIAVSPLVMTGASGTINGCAITSGIPDPVVRVGLSNGLFYIVPVKSFVAPNLVFGYTLPALGGATITSVQNANQRAGGCFVESLDPPSSFCVESDQGGEPNQVGVRAKGCIPNMSLGFDMAKHLEFVLGWLGVDWDDPTTSPPSQLADPVNNATADFCAAQCDVLFQSITVPDLATQQQVSTLDIKLSPVWSLLDATTSRLSTGANPGSPIFNIKRTAPFEELIKMGMRLSDKAWITKRSAHEKGQLMYTWYDGDPGQTGTRAIALHFREAELDDDPTEGDGAGIMGHGLEFKVLDPLDADAIGTLKTRASLHIFNN
jgi:hypothetical protein